MATIYDENGVIPVIDEAGGQVLDEAGGAVLPSSIFPIGLTVEILINGSWVDISPYILQRDGITITAGQPSEAATSKPAVPGKMNLTANNKDGRFSPNNVSGPYYPYLQRNVQIRVTATATSTTG